MKRKHKNMKHPHMRTLIIVAVLLLAAAAGVWIIAVRGETMVSSAQRMPFYASYPHVYTGEGFLYIEGSTLHYYDLNDSGASYSVTLQNPAVELSGEGSVHVIYTASSLALVNSEFPIEFSGEIASVECGGGFIAVHKIENDLDSIRIFNSAGTQVDEIVFEGTRLMDFGFYNTGSTWSLYSLQTDVTASSPVSTLTTYSLDPPATTGVAVVQNQLVSDVSFSGSSIFVTGTANIIRFSASTNTESYRLLCHGFKILDNSLSGGSAVFVAAPNGADAQELPHVRIYTASQTDIPEEEMSALQLPRDTLEVFAAGNRVYVVTPNRILKYTPQTELKSVETLPFTATGACKLSSDRLLIYSGEETHLLPFVP